LPASWIYGAFSAGIRRVRTLDPPQRHEALVVSVGNIEMGGSGKTPVVMKLLGTAVSVGKSGTYVSRAFHSRAERFDGVTVVGARDVPVRPVAGIRIVRRDHADLASEIGDEAAMVARRLPDISLALSRHKTRAVAVAEAVFAPDVVVLDDAFQSWSVHRDLNIVLVDPCRPFGNGRLLPAGTLREEPAALSRADLVVVNGVRDARDTRRVERAVRAEGLGVPVTGLERSLSFTTGTSAWEPEAADPVPSLDPRALGAVATVSGIARPDAFDTLVARAGARCVLSLRFPDHHRYSADDVSAIVRRTRARGIGTVVTTEKDNVKFAPPAFAGVRVVVARLRVRFTEPGIVEKTLKPRQDATASTSPDRRFDRI